MSKKICYLDMDGVIANFVAGVLKRFSVKQNPYETDEKHLGNWYIQEILGIPNETFYDALDHDFWANLPKTRESDDIVNIALRVFGEDRVRICTTPTIHPGSYSGKFEWIDDHYPFLRRSLVTTATKEELAGPERLLIDDSDKNVEAFESAGGKTFLYPRPWNKRHPSRDKGFVLLERFLLKEEAC